MKGTMAAIFNARTRGLGAWPIHIESIIVCHGYFFFICLSRELSLQLLITIYYLKMCELLYVWADNAVLQWTLGPKVFVQHETSSTCEQLIQQAIPFWTSLSICVMSSFFSLFIVDFSMNKSLLIERHLTLKPSFLIFFMWKLLELEDIFTRVRQTKSINISFSVFVLILSSRR